MSLGAELVREGLATVAIEHLEIDHVQMGGVVPATGLVDEGHDLDVPELGIRVEQLEVAVDDVLPGVVVDPPFAAAALEPIGAATDRLTFGDLHRMGADQRLRDPLPCVVVPVDGCVGDLEGQHLVGVVEVDVCSWGCGSRARCAARRGTG